MVKFAHAAGGLGFVGSDSGCGLMHCSSSHAVVVSYVK